MPPASGLMGEVFGMIVTCLKRRRSSAVYPSRASVANHCALSTLLFRRAAVCKSSRAAPCLVPCNTGDLDTSFEDDLLRCWEAMEQSDNSTEVSGKGLPLPLPCYGEENGSASNATRADRVRSERVLTFELVSQYFYMPITQAARELNVGLTILKKRCRELGIPRWPHRKLKSLRTLINDVEVLQEAGKADDDGQLRALVEMLEQERRLLEQKPYVELEEKTKRLRQACFKASYKKRRLLALEPGEASKYY
uniref:RWP-RK domain-containing protein n=1 Tax=Hordeum vulgare subsp. vulgare TaxID=112509 RepID=A0A8I6Z2T2_HORVV